MQYSEFRGSRGQTKYYPNEIINHQKSRMARYGHLFICAILSCIWEYLAIHRSIHITVLSISTQDSFIIYRLNGTFLFVPNLSTQKHMDITKNQRKNIISHRNTVYYPRHTSHTYKLIHVIKIQKYSARVKTHTFKYLSACAAPYQSFLRKRFVIPEQPTQSTLWPKQMPQRSLEVSGQSPKTTFVCL